MSKKTSRKISKPGAKHAAFPANNPFKEVSSPHQDVKPLAYSAPGDAIDNQWAVSASAETNRLVFAILSGFSSEVVYKILQKHYAENTNCYCLHIDHNNTPYQSVLLFLGVSLNPFRASGRAFRYIFLLLLSAIAPLRADKIQHICCVEDCERSSMGVFSSGNNKKDAAAIPNAANATFIECIEQVIPNLF